MKKTLEALLELRSLGTIGQFAIGGAVAAGFYIEALATEDLDVFAFMSAQPNGLVTLTPLYDALKKMGGTVQNEHVVLFGWPLQILPAYTPLVEEAISTADLQPFEGLSVPVVGAAYLCAIGLQTGRPKDYQRVMSLIESGAVDAQLLADLVIRFALQERWQTYLRRFG
jgi:hypothetical protein